MIHNTSRRQTIIFFVHCARADLNRAEIAMSFTCVRAIARAI